MGDLHFVPGERRIGLRAENLDYSLHENIQPIEQPRAQTPDSVINAPPQSDPSDDDLEGQDEEFSDDESPPMEKATATAITLVAGNKSPPDGLYVNPSDIPATRFSSGEASEIPSGLLFKRRKDAINARASTEEDMPSSFESPRKRTRRNYSTRTLFTNVHKSKPSLKSSKTLAETSLSATADADVGKKFRIPETDSALKQVDQLKQPNTPKKAFKHPPKDGNSQRVVRTSNRLSKNGSGVSTNECFENNFKIPATACSPKAKEKKNRKSQISIAPVILSDGGSSPRTTRSKAPFKKPEILSNTSPLSTSNIQDLLETTRTKLNLPEITPTILSSSIPASSIPSTSHDVSSPISSLSSPPSSPETDALIKDLPLHTDNIPIFREPTISAKCPMCKERVDRIFLEDFDSGAKRLTVRQQTQFCKAHNTRSAGTEWVEKGYPKIDWLHFEERLTKYHAALEDVLNSRQHSFYRNSFEDQVKNRQSRMTDLEGLEPGYYGSRGAKVMMKSITSHFAPQLRRLAASDRLVSSRGVSGYVQAVLVPELAVMLVREDMGVDEESARAIIRDSVKVGRLLCEEEDEMIRDKDDGVDEVS